MGKIKGWKFSKKYDGSNPSKYTIYQSIINPRKIYVSIGLVGKTKKGYWAITDNGVMAQFEYPTFNIAKKEAMKYMRSHPNG